VREKPIMARHHRMPPEEAGYTYAVEPTAIDRLLANEEESIYGRWRINDRRPLCAQLRHSCSRQLEVAAAASLHACMPEI
jgi:hypothetical protein